MIRNGEVISQLRHKHKLIVLVTRSEEATFLVGSQLAVIRCGMGSLFSSIFFMLLVAAAYLIPLYTSVLHAIHIHSQVKKNHLKNTFAFTLGWVRWSSAMEH